MAEKNKPLTEVATNLSPGVATAAAQAQLTKDEQQQLAAFGELKKTHQYLLTLPKDDAYKNFKSLTPEYQSALTTYFNPKYRIEDKGFVGNILRSLKSSANYSVQSIKELGMQIAGLPVVPTTGANLPEAILTLATGAPVSVNKETGVASGAGRVLETLVRPQEKLIKQPYQAARLAQEEGDTGEFLFERFFVEGFKELLPGGEDAAVADITPSDTWMKFWKQASDKENVFDASEVARIESRLTPDVAYVGKLLAGRKNFSDNYEDILKNPDALNLIQRYTAGEKDAMQKVANAVVLYEQAKISPGRDVARALASAFPFEAERAKNGNPIDKKFFNFVSGVVDFSVTFGLDPLILTAKAKKASDVARFGLIKLGENPTNLDKAWKNKAVQRYWDTLGKLFVAYEKGDIATKGQVLTQIDAVAKYLDGKGNELAKRFAIYNSKGSYEFARRIYADTTSTLRDYSGRLNNKLIKEIKGSGGIDNFDFKQLHKYNQDFQMPKAVLGRELVPLQAGDDIGFFDRVMKNGYAWVGKQISILDREPLTYGNYLSYRGKLNKYESNIKNGLVNAGIDLETADKLARTQAHEVGINLARQRTLGYVDNSEIRTNLAFNIRNFGRYYRATEDFYRRAMRIGKYEKEAIVRLAITNQTFEHSGFVHEDANGELYFTYPGDDVLNYVLGNTVFRLLGIPGAQPMAANFGGKVKMLTPSLDPESAAPRLGGPFIGISLAVLQNITKYNLTKDVSLTNSIM